jgi:hypothetical protein
MSDINLVRHTELPNTELTNLQRYILEKLERALVGSSIPGYMCGGILRYFVGRVPPGDFLMGILTNDLGKACKAADEENKHLIWYYHYFMYNYAPGNAWGSKKAVEDWIKGRDLETTKATEADVK